MKSLAIHTANANPLTLQSYARKKKLPFSTLKEKRTVTLEWIKENLAGTEIENSGITIKLSWQGLKNDVAHHHGENVSKLHSFTVIDRIIKNAKYLDKEPDKHGNDRITFYKFYSKVKIKRNKFDVFIYLKGTEQGTAIYDHILFLE